MTIDNTNYQNTPETTPEVGHLVRVFYIEVPSKIIEGNMVKRAPIGEIVLHEGKLMVYIPSTTGGEDLLVDLESDNYRVELAQDPETGAKDLADALSTGGVKVLQ